MDTSLVSIFFSFLFSMNIGVCVAGFKRKFVLKRSNIDIYTLIGRNMQIAKFGFEPKRGYKNNESSDSDSDSDDSDNSAKRAKGIIFFKLFIRKYN